MKDIDTVYFCFLVWGCSSWGNILNEVFQYGSCQLYQTRGLVAKMTRDSKKELFGYKSNYAYVAKLMVVACVLFI